MGLGSDEKGALVSLCGYLPDLGLDSSLPAGPPRTELGLPHSPSAPCSDLLLQPLKTPVCQSNHLCKCLFLPSLQMSVPQQAPCPRPAQRVGSCMAQSIGVVRTCGSYTFHTLQQVLNGDLSVVY